MRYPFLQQIYNYKFGKTLIHHPDKPEQLQNILAKAKERNVKINFPVDSICAQDMKTGIPTKTCTNE